MRPGALRRRVTNPLEPDAYARDHLVGRRIAVSAVEQVLVLRATILDAGLERPGKLHLHTAAEAKAAGVVLQLVERTGRGERLGIERGIPNLAIGCDTGSQRNARARADVILPVRFKALTRAREAVGKLGVAVAGRKLAFNAHESAAEAEVISHVDAIDRGIRVCADG